MIWLTSIFSAVIWSLGLVSVETGKMISSTVHVDSSFPLWNRPKYMEEGIGILNTLQIS